MMNLRGNMLSVAAVLTAIVGVAVSFPLDMFSFRPSERSGQNGAFAAFVSLDEAEESAALKAAKSSWNGEGGGVRHLRAELFFSDLPKEESEPVLELADRSAWSLPSPVDPGLVPYMPSLAAPPPEAIPQENAGAVAAHEPAFSREELLKID